MRTKVCQHCFKKKALNAFNTDYCARDGLSRWCRHCIDRYSNMKVIADTKETGGYKREYRLRVSKIKTESGCVECGETFEACLEFHHLHPEIKIDTIPNMIKFGYTWEEILEEISKCKILCVNCHRKLHFIERQQGEEYDT